MLQNDHGTHSSEEEISQLRDVHTVDIPDVSMEALDEKQNQPKQNPDFVFCRDEGLRDAEVEELRAKWGTNTLREITVPTWRLIAHTLIRPMPITLFAAAIIEGVIQNFEDMGLLLTIQVVNTAVSFSEMRKAENAVKALKATLKPKALCKRDGTWSEIDTSELVPGDMVLLAAGSAVPADCVLNPGFLGSPEPEIEVDQSALTGESRSIVKKPGVVCNMGTLVVTGEAEATVTATGEYTVIGKTALMMQNVEVSGGPLEMLLLKIMLILVITSLALCSVALGYIVAMSRLNEQNRLLTTPSYVPKTESVIVKDSLSFAVVLLVASVPVAIEIVTTTTLALGSRTLSMHGALVSKLASIEALAGMDMLCCDKTGTLTINKMTIQDDCPIFSPGETKESLVLQAMLATKWKEPPRDAIDSLILLNSGLSPTSCNNFKQLEYIPFTSELKRTEAYLQSSEGQTFRVTKGAPSTILEMCANKEEIRPRFELLIRDYGERGMRALAIARYDDDDPRRWRMLGILTFVDPPHPDTMATLQECKRIGVSVKMVTGDQLIIAQETARILNMGTNILGNAGLPALEEGKKIPTDLPEKYGALIIPADGFAEVYPEQKFLIVECLRQAGFRCGMTGDGVNDAPALQRADVGIAVQGSTDAARAAADIILTRKDLKTIVFSIITAREIFSRLKNFLMYRIAATLQLLIFFFIAVFWLRPVDFLKSNFCPQNLIATAVSSCYAAQMPMVPTLIGNDIFVDWYASQNQSIPIQLLVATPWTCGRDQSFCQYNASLGVFMQNGYFADTKGRWTTSKTACLTDQNGNCLRATASWPDFFQLPVLMLMLLTLLNDGTLISVGYDRVVPSKLPERWNVVNMFIVSSVMGFVACWSSLLLLWAALDSNNPNGLFAGIGIPPLEYGKIVTAVYLKISLSDFLTLLSVRTKDEFFWTHSPSRVLMSAALFSLSLSTIMACAWPEGWVDRIPVMGLALGDYKLMPIWIWMYCVLCWFIQDSLKVSCKGLLQHFQVFHGRGSKKRRRYQQCLSS